MKIMKVAIIRSGNVDRTLGTRWAKRGREVIFGVREATRPKVRGPAGRGGRQGSRCECEPFALGSSAGSRVCESVTN